MNIFKRLTLSALAIIILFLPQFSAQAWFFETDVISNDPPETVSPIGDEDIPPSDSRDGQVATGGSCINVGLRATWSSFGTTNWNLIFSGPADSKGYEAIDNCSGSTPTATGITDDNDRVRALTEDNSRGGDRQQLCLGTTQSGISIVSDWQEGSCNTGTIDMGVYDSNEGNYSDPEGKRYYHKHDFNEEESTRNDIRWCLGVQSPGDNYELQSRKVSGVGTCAADETYLFYSDDTRWNMNNEDHPDRTSLCAKIIPKSAAVCSSNLPPNPPAITGPTTGAPGTHTFSFLATDPEGNTIRYGIDWDNNSTVDQYLPSSGYVASNTSQSSPYTWNTPGTYTFKALTQDSNGASSGWTSHSIVIGTAPSLPTANLTVNSQDGPLDVAEGTPLTITWSSTGATTCTAYGAGWGTATPVATTGSASTNANQTDTYILQCTDGTNTATDSVQVNLTNTLKVCQNTCSSGIQRGNFTLAQGGSQNLVSCFNPAQSCTDSTGNVTSSTTWTEASPAGGAISLTGTNPKTVTGINSGTENLEASYNSQTQNLSISVSCIPTTDCSNAPGRDNYCQNESFSVDNGCSVSLSCTGSKTCDFNWKEVAP